MHGFALRRFAQALPTLFGITLLTFVLLWVAPGDPAASVLAGSADVTAEDIAALRQAGGFDQSLPAAYLQWLRLLLSGNLGVSLVNHRPVAELLAAALPNTVLLIGLASALALGLGVPLGVVAARRRGSWIDHALRVLTVAGHAVPSFWLGLVFILLFAVHLRLLPSGGAQSVGATAWDLGDRLRHLVGPVLVLSLAGLATYARLVRTELLDVWDQDYVRTAHAKGLPERRVVWGHALRPALLPVVTALGGVLAQLVSGALVIEQVFAWPGMGRLAFDAARARDTPVVLASVLLSGGLLVTGFVLRDLAYGLVDPRLRRPG